MMKRIAYLVVLLVLLAGGRVVAGRPSFEQTLREFRFGLYPLLDSCAGEEEFFELVEVKESSPASRLGVLARNFLKEHAEDIRAYREYLLERLASGPPVAVDSLSYEQVEGDINSRFEKVRASWYESGALPALFLLEPLKGMELYRRLNLANRISAREYSRRSVRQEVGGMLISARRLEDGRWEVMQDCYYEIYRFVYDLDEGQVVEMKVWQLREVGENAKRREEVRPEELEQPKKPKKKRRRLQHLGT